MFNVWSVEELSPMFAIVTRTVSTYVADAAAKTKLEQIGGLAYRLADKTLVSDQLTAAGFCSVVETPVTIVVTDTTALGRGLVIGTPFCALVPPDQRAACVEQTVAALGTSCSLQAHLYEAKV